MSRKIALNLPAVVVNPPRKVSLHLLTVLAPRRFLTTPQIDWDECRADAESFPGQSVVRLGVETRIGQDGVKSQIAAGLNQRRCKLRSIIVWSPRYDASAEQVCVGITYCGDFGPGSVTPGPFMTSVKIVRADVMAFQPGAVNCSFRPLREQFQRLGTLENSPQEALKSPFFSSRFSA